MIRTARLVLRLATPHEVPAIVDYYRRNRKHLAPWEPVRPASFYVAAHWRRQVRANLREFRAGQSLRLFVFTRRDPAGVIGTVNFANLVRGAFEACTVGYALDERMEGCGYMAEALRAAIDYVFGTLHLHRVMANYMPHNRRSARLLRRLGFRVEGRARAYLRIAGRWRDHVLTSLVNPDWKASRR